jgi:hypothetical protein
MSFVFCTLPTLRSAFDYAPLVCPSARAKQRRTIVEGFVEYKGKNTHTAERSGAARSGQQLVI